MSGAVQHQTVMPPLAVERTGSPNVVTIPRELWAVVYRLAAGRNWPPQADEDLTRLFEFANQQQVFPLLMDDGDLPDEVIAGKSKFRAWQALYRRQSDIRQQAAAELVRVLGPENFIFYKGSDYCHRLYDKPEHRPMADIDILVPEYDFNGIVARLEGAGYRQKFSGANATFAPDYYEAKVIVGGVLVEIHRSFGQRIRAGIDYRAIWQRREAFAQDGISGYRLAPVDAILCHAFNLVKDEFSPELNRFVDFYLLLKLHQDHLPCCVRYAKAWGIERALFGALHVTAKLFHEVDTKEVRSAMAQVLSHRTRRFLVNYVLPNPALESSRNSRGRCVQIWRKFMLMDLLWRRLAFAAYHLYTTTRGAAIAYRARRKGGQDVR